MSTFKLEVGGKCNNGAVVLSLWCDDVDGVRANILYPETSEF